MEATELEQKVRDMIPANCWIDVYWYQKALNALEQGQEDLAKVFATWYCFEFETKIHKKRKR